MKKWEKSVQNREIIQKLAASCGISPLTAAVLASRGYSSPDSVRESINADSLSDPFLIKDMQAAVDTINQAIDENQLICVYGDYDCDGIMSCVILYTYLRESGANVMYYIPERSEGYGMNKDAIRKICDDGAKLIITVDNGISAISESEYIYSLGMKLVVTDHHQQGEQLPKAEAVVDPHRPDCLSPFKYACGAVIALKLVAALNDGDYTSALEQFGDLAAIATVADIVKLKDENRFIVSYGLELINNTDRPALIALKEVSGLAGKKIDSRSVAFGLSPRINASGRFGSPETAVKLFLCESYEEALPIAQELNKLNEERKSTENKIIAQIYQMLNENPMLMRDRAIFVCGKNWHHGVIGIVASKIMERFGKPCFIASEENGEIRGSARSFGDFSVFDALTYAKDSLEKFGGHVGAGGFTIKKDMVYNFRQLINRFALENHKEMPIYTIKTDVTITPGELTVENVQELEILEPYGEGNEKPNFLIENAQILNIISLSGGLHTKIKIAVGNIQTEALMFWVSPDAFPLKVGDNCDIVATLDKNEYRENISLSIKIEDIRPHGFNQDKFFNGLNVFEAFTRNEILPDHYYSAMLPTRDMTAYIYKCIPKNNGINSDTLYIKVQNPDINYCRFCIAVEAMRQLGFITVSSADSMIRIVPDAPKTDLNSASILVSLRENMSQIKI